MSSMNNQYWEDQRREFFAKVEEDELLKKVSECQFVIDKLEQDELWKIIQKDVNEWVKRVDQNWQEVYDEKQLKQMRVIKLSASHLLNLKNAYLAEWKLAQEELTRRKDPTIIEKDYDRE